MVLLVGINGAGKTTFYYTKIKPFHDANGMNVPFVNADEIEKANKLGDSYTAARQAARLRKQYLSEGQSFVTETVFSHQSKIDLIGDAQKHGFEVVLNHVHVEDPELAYSRVQTRIAMGGHPVPKKKVDERFPRTFKNIQEAATKADRTYVWDNNLTASENQPMHRFVLSMVRGSIVKITNEIPAWAKDMYGGPITQYEERIDSVIDYVKKSLKEDSSPSNKQAIYNILLSENLSEELIDKVFEGFGGFSRHWKI